MSALPSLELLAMVAVEAGQMVMEAGANAKSVDGIVEMLAKGLGAERVDLRIGYASLGITLAVGESAITRMHRVGRQMEGGTMPGTVSAAR